MNSQSSQKTKKVKKEKTSKARKLKGVVVSAKMDKTVVVKVTMVKKHPLYKKRYRASKKYHAHDEKNLFKEGDVVIIQESRPFSKTKKWYVVEKVKK